MIALASRASDSITSHLPSRIISSGATQEPPTQTTFGTARYSSALSAETPPVGQKRAAASGEARAKLVEDRGAVPDAGYAEDRDRHGISQDTVRPLTLASLGFGRRREDALPREG